MAQDSQLVIAHPSPLEAPNISLAVPGTTSYLAALGGLFGNRASSVQDVSPYMTILMNDSPDTVVAYSITFRAIKKRGGKITFCSHYNYPDAVAGSGERNPFGAGREVRPGERRLKGVNFEIYPDEDLADLSDYRVVASDALSGTGGLTNPSVEIDALLLDNGSFYGSDECHLEENFTAYLRAKQELYKLIVEALAQRKTLETGLAEADARAAAVLSSSPPVTDPRRAYLLRYPKRAISDVRHWYRSNPDVDAGKVFIGALRGRPFVIKHLDSKPSFGSWQCST